ncbi:Hypothetical protein, putative [Bodo saltans]|uniref:Uncharacterized protein n=1 Tax=Bodo saltans TaxID=75058 RepID=A0A0S4IHZ0_BODSA|nr:Hypothetical protein, putative [Bodo saltans]|eukprot:CUE70005.1 Hypothetical protein, putative [Bodo saltans]
MSSEGYRVGIHLGFSYTSCATWSQYGGYESHRFAMPKKSQSKSHNSSSSSSGASGRYIKTSLFCQATSTLDGVPLLRAEEGHSSLVDLLPSLLEMSDNPLEEAEMAHNEHTGTSVHMSGQRIHRSEGGANKVPHAFLWGLFRDDTVESSVEGGGGSGAALSSHIALRVEQNTMEAAVFLVWVLRQIMDRLIANSYLNHTGGNNNKNNNNTMLVESLVLSIPTCAFTSAPYKVDALTVAADAAATYVEQLYHGNLRIGKLRIVSDALSLVASQAASLGLPISALSSQDSIPTSNDEDRVLLACHVGGVSNSFSFVKLPKDLSTDPFVLFSSVADTTAAGGDAIDHAILHHILGHHQNAYIDSPLSADAKLLLLDRICRAKEACLNDRAAVQVNLLGGPAASDPAISFKLTAELIESVATDTLFRKFTKTLQQASTSALQTSGCPRGVGTTAPHSATPQEIKKMLESLPLQAMRLLRPALVMTTGRGLLVTSLKKRVESLCRTLGATGGGLSSAAASSLSPVTFFHEQQDPNMEGMCSYGALVLEEWRKSPIAGLQATARAATHRPAMGMLFEEPQSPERRPDRLTHDVLIRTHGDCWGMLAPHGTPLPLYRTRSLELLNRNPTDSLEGSGRFSIGASGSTGGGLLHAEVDICSYLSSPENHDPTPLCSLDVWLPKLSASEGGPARFSVTLDLRIGDDGEVTVSLVHEASGTVLQKRSSKHLDIVAHS